MDLSDALGPWPSSGNNQSGGGGGPWPGGNNQSGGGGLWPGAGGQPNAPTWPGGPAGGSQPTWPGGPGGGSQPTWPGGPAGGSQPTWPSPGPGPTPPIAPQQSLVVPYNQILPQGVFNKMLITINGTVKSNADKITVDLGTDDDLAFHFNPRFNESGRQAIVRNSCIGKKWGKEERDLSHFPFAPGQNFEIKILCTDREFKVAVNGSHLLEYKHRVTDLKKIKKLNIYYDLTLSKVNVETLS